MNTLQQAIRSFFIPTSNSRGSEFYSLESLLLPPGKKKLPAVGTSTALTIPAYYNGVNQIANDIAKLPKGVFQKEGDSRKKVDHSVNFIINKEANSFMDAQTFHFVMVLAAIHRGNGVAIIDRDKNTAAINGLNFVHPDDLRDIRLIAGAIYYFTKNGVYRQDDVIHILGFTDNGIYGKGVIRHAAEVMGIAKAAQDFTALNFVNRGTGFGVVSSEKQVGKSAKQAIESAINTKLSAPGEIKTVLLDEGMKYDPIHLNMAEAQLIEQAKFSVLDIARFLNISPRKLKDLSVNNYASAYMDSVDHTTDSIQPWKCKFEQEYDRKLFSDAEKSSNHYTRFNENILLRGDLKSKADYYYKMTSAGIMTRNEARAFEEMNPIDGLSEPLTPAQLQTFEQINKSLQNETGPGQ